MATPTYDPIASTTLTASASSVTFSSLDTIAAGYRDLIIVCEGLSSGGNGYLKMQINGDTGTNYYGVNMRGNGSSTYSRADTRSDFLFGLGNVYWSTTDRCQNLIQLFDFSDTGKHKSLLGRTDSSATGTCAEAMRWASTSAITSIEISVNNYSFAAGSTFSLYGVAA